MNTPAPADLERLARVREHWINYGNCTEPADRARAEAGVRAAYTAAGLTAPRYIFWVGSPLAAIIAAAILPAALGSEDAAGPVKVAGENHLASLRDATRRHAPAVNAASQMHVQLNRALAPVEQAITAALIDSTGQSERGRRRRPDTADATALADTRRLINTVRDTLAAQLDAYAADGPVHADTASAGEEITKDDTTLGEGIVPRDVDNSIMETVVNPVVAACNRELEHQIITEHMTQAARSLQRSDRETRDGLEHWWRGRIWAQYNSGYFAYTSGLEALGYDIEPLRGQMEVAAAAGWWWAFHGYSILTERAHTIAYDPQNRLHRADGPAIEYPDGWGVYSWNGHRVPSWVIQAPTVERIIDETNTEVRRCAIESYGWDRFVTDAHLELIDSCPDPGNTRFQLELYDVPTNLWGSPTRVLLCTNGSPRADGVHPRFGLRVPAENNLNTALAAAAWGYGLPPELYASMQRRA